MKISIIGAGNVGGLTAMRLVEKGIADIVLVDVVKGFAQAKAYDLDDARSLIGHNSSIIGTEDFSVIAGSDIVVVTAGLARKPGMSREDLLNKNYLILKNVAGYIKKFAQKAIVVVVSNPVDIMTYVMLKETGFDKRMVFGMGGGLDSSRFNNLISKKTDVSSSKISSPVVGAHGETMIPLPRFTKVNDKLLTDILSEDGVRDLVRRTKNRGAEMVSLYGSGSAYFAPSAAIADICESMIKGNQKDFFVSAYLEGEYGASDVCIGVPVRLDKGGIKEIKEWDLNAQEKKIFTDSVENIKNSIKVIYA